MSHTSDPNSGILSMISGIFALVSLTSIQPILTFLASIALQTSCNPLAKVPFFNELEKYID